MRDGMIALKRGSSSSLVKWVFCRASSRVSSTLEAQEWRPLKARRGSARRVRMTARKPVELAKLYLPLKDCCLKGLFRLVANHPDRGDKIHGALECGIKQRRFFLPAAAFALRSFFGVDFRIDPGHQGCFV